jgi:hypothetical protein
MLYQLIFSQFFLDVTKDKKILFKWFKFDFSTFSSSSTRIAKAWISSESSGRLVSDSFGPPRIGEIGLAPLPPALPFSK